MKLPFWTSRTAAFVRKACGYFADVNERATSVCADALSRLAKRWGVLAAIAALIAVSVGAASGAGILFQATFRALGTGATDRTAMAKLRDIVSAADFCSVIDGVTDNRTCIQNAVNAGRSVYFPPSNFLVTGPIYLHTTGQQLYSNGTTITASGVTTTVFWVGTTDGITFAKTDNVTIDGFTLIGAADGLGSPSTTPVGVYVQAPITNPYVEGGGCSGLVVSNNTISGFLAGVSATAADRVQVVHNKFTGMKYYSGLAAGGYSVLLQTVFHPQILNNKFIATATDRHAIYLSSDPGRTLDNNNVCKSVIVEGNDIDWTGVNGVGPTKFEVAVAARAPENFEFTGNIVKGGYGGIDYDLLNGNGKMTNISGNIFTGQVASVTGERASINYLRSSGTYTGTGLTITGNTIDLPSAGAFTHGIQLSYITEVQISGNLIRNNGISNITFGTNATQVMVSGNTLECNTSFCYRFASTGNANITLGKDRIFNNGGALYTFISNPTNLRFGFPRCAVIVANSTGSPTFSNDTDGIVTSVATDANGISVTLSGAATNGSNLNTISLTAMGSNIGNVYNRNSASPLIIGVLGTTSPLAALPSATNTYNVLMCLND